MLAHLLFPFSDSDFPAFSRPFAMLSLRLLLFFISSPSIFSHLLCLVALLLFVTIVSSVPAFNFLLLDFCFLGVIV